MASYKSLQELLKKSVVWEQHLQDLYDVAGLGLKDERSRELVGKLRDQQKSNIEILSEIDVEKYGPGEWVRFSIDYHEDKLIPRKTIKRDSSPAEILDSITDYEQKLKNYYQAVLDSLRSREQKELFQSLVRFRDQRIKQIESLRQR